MVRQQAGGEGVLTLIDNRSIDGLKGKSTRTFSNTESHEMNTTRIFQITVLKSPHTASSKSNVFIYAHTV